VDYTNESPISAGSPDGPQTFLRAYRTDEQILVGDEN
jgi:hypothetical protein